MDYLYQRNRWVAAQEGRASRAPEPGTEITAKGKRVIVIGGGDTGMDCISNSHREGAHSVIVLDVYAQLPASGRDARHPWPLPPKRTLSTYALEEGGKRRWGTEVTGFGGKDGAVSHVYARQVTGTSSRDLTPGARQRVRAGGRPRAARHRLRASRARRSRERWRSSSTAAATSAPSRPTAPRLTASTRAAMPAWASRSWSPRSPKGASARGSSTATSAAARWTPIGRNWPSARGAVRPTELCATRPKRRAPCGHGRSSSAAPAPGRVKGQKCRAAASRVLGSLARAPVAPRRTHRFMFRTSLGRGNSPLSVRELRPHFPDSPGGSDGSGPPGPFNRPDSRLRARALDHGVAACPGSRCATVCAWQRSGRSGDRPRGHHHASIGATVSHFFDAAGTFFSQLASLSWARCCSGLALYAGLPAAALAGAGQRAAGGLPGRRSAGAMCGAPTWSATRSTTCFRSAAATWPSCS